MKEISLCFVLLVLCGIGQAEHIKILSYVQASTPIILKAVQESIVNFAKAFPGYPHTFEAVGNPDVVQLYSKVVSDAAKPYAQREYSAYVVTLSWMGDLASYAEPLTQRVLNDPVLNWQDVPPFFQRVSTLDGQVYAIILDGDQHVVYYRRSLLQQAGFTAPQTWEDYIAIAKYFDGKDLNGDGTPDFGSCITKTSNGIAYNMYFSMMASATQSNGTSQGLFFNNQDMTGVFNTPAAKQAMWNWYQTSMYGPGNEGESYGLTEQRNDFMSGRCALTLDWGDTGAYSYRGNPYIKNDLGTSALPGSFFVNKDGNRVQCTKSSCPYMDSMGINKTPFGANGGGHGAFIMKDAPNGVKDALYDLFRYISNTSLPLVLREDTGFDPFKYSHLDVNAWVNAGMDQQDAALYVKAFSDSLTNPNFGFDLRIPKTGLYQKAVDEGLKLLVTGAATVDEAANYIQQAVEKVTDDAGRQSQLNALRTSLGLPPATLPTRPPSTTCPTAAPSTCPPPTTCPPTSPCECPKNRCNCPGTEINVNFAHLLAR